MKSGPLIFTSFFSIPNTNFFISCSLMPPNVALAFLDFKNSWRMPLAMSRGEDHPQKLAPALCMTSAFITLLLLLKLYWKFCLFFQKQFKLECFGESTIHGFVTWFSVTFPGDINLSTSPYTEYVVYNYNGLSCW